MGGDRLVSASFEYVLALHPRGRVVGFFDLGNVYASDFEGLELPARIPGEPPGRFFVTLALRF